MLLSRVITVSLGVSLLAAGCDSPSGPNSPIAGQALSGIPRFAILPTTGCGLGQAWNYEAAHVRSDISVDFGGLTQCGDLVFWGQTGNFNVGYAMDPAGEDRTVHVWQRRTRDSSSGANTDANVREDTVPLDVFVNRSFSQTLDSRLDGVLWNLHLRDNATGSLASIEVNGEIYSHLWKRMPAPTVTSTDIRGDTVTINWSNGHNGRGIDRTVIRRLDGNGNVVSSGTVVGQTASYTETGVPSGTWRYELQHNSDKLTGYMQAEIWSAATETTVTVGLPPTQLACYGNFEPTTDCYWANALSDASTEVRRTGTLAGTAPPGATSFTDTGVERNRLYLYDVRHVKSGFKSTWSEAVTVRAEPQPPNTLVCGVEGTTALRCSWNNGEPSAETEVWRSTSEGGTYIQLATVAAGEGTYLDSGLPERTTFWYKTRHIKNGEVTAWSNTASATTGSLDPQRPTIP